MKTLAVAGAIAFVAGAVAACAGKGGDARFPRQPEGCNVTLYHLEPEVPTENIGPVRATCAEEVPEADCVRTLKDEVCKLGGDVVWGVDEPKTYAGKKMWSGRAAHTRVRGARDAGAAGETDAGTSAP